MAGRAGPLADVDPFAALAFAGRTFGGAWVSQFPAPSPSRGACRTDRGPRRRLVHWGRRSGSWHETDRDGTGRIPVGAVARVVALGGRLHRNRACGTPGAAATRATQLLQRTGLECRLALYWRSA